MPKQKILSNKEVREFLSELPLCFSHKLLKKATYFVKKINDTKLMFVNKKPYFFKNENIWIPTLFSVRDLKLELKKVTVDKGAVPFIVNGADVMRPGITGLDDFGENETIQIVDENNKVAIAIGEALFDSEKIKTLNSGKVIKTLHYVGDFIWKQA